jgi:predicted site-specific integrase-resolvase
VLQLRKTVVTQEGRTIAYLRVARPNQRPDQENQRKVLEQFCAARGLAVEEWSSEDPQGGPRGLTFQRLRLLTLVRAVLAEEVGTLVLADKDWLARWGYALLEQLCADHQCTVLVLKGADAFACARDRAGSMDQRPLLLPPPRWAAPLPRDTQGGAGGRCTARTGFV